MKVKIDDAKHEVTVGNREVHLGPSEYVVLWALHHKRGAVVSRDELSRELETRFRTSFGENSRTIDQHVARIRKAVKVPVIKTVSRFGYRFIG